MTGKRKGLLLGGVILLTLSLGTWLAEQRWIAAQAPLVERYISERGRTSEDSVYTTFQQSRSDPRTPLRSEPPGAVVYRQGEPLADEGKEPYRTPVLAPGLATRYQELEYRTPWRSAKVLSHEQPTRLSPNLLYRFTALLGVLGVVCLGLAFKPVPPAEPQEDERGEIEEADRFGDYQRLQLLGKGSMGNVYEARSLKAGDEQRYALKVMLPEWSESEMFRARFEREGAICRKLEHPGIVRVYAQDSKGEQLWLVMDLIEGRELGDWVSQEQPSTSQLSRLFAALCEALAYAHQTGVIHRDLKPENIMVNKEGQPIITDFGLARGQHYATITQANTTIGTPAYMAPEAVRGLPNNDVRTDLYALGCILYECLAGREPFQGTAIEVIVAQMNDEPQPLSELCEAPAELIAVVETLMRKDKEERYSSALEVRDALQALSS